MKAKRKPAPELKPRVVAKPPKDVDFSPVYIAVSEWDAMLPDDREAWIKANIPWEHHHQTLVVSKAALRFAPSDADGADKSEAPTRTVTIAAASRDSMGEDSYKAILKGQGFVEHLPIVETRIDTGAYVLTQEIVDDA
jgi:hypothetical protein